MFACVQLSSQGTLNTLQVTYTAKDKSITDIFTDLHQDYDLNFAYASEDFESIKTDVAFNDSSIKSVLEELTLQNKLEYKIIEDVIMVRKSEAYDELVSSQNYQTSYHLQGRVVDSESKKPMSFATIAIPNTTIGTYTDDEGRFDIEVPAKYAQQEIAVSYLGYNNQAYTIQEATNAFLLVPLNVSACTIDEITIVNREATIAVATKDQAMRLNKSMLDNSTSGLVGNDLSRNLQLMPGISANDDSSADIKIRGSNSDETLLILDGIPVYNASHFYGIFSSINASYLEQVNLYKNAFPIQYGGKTAGVVEMLSSEELQTKLKMDAEVNFLSGTVNLTLPISKVSNLLLSGRSTLKDVNNTSFNSFTDKPSDEVTVRNFTNGFLSEDTDPNFKYYDLNAKYLWKPNTQSSFSLNLFASNDDYDNDFKIEGKRERERRTELQANNEEKWSNFGVSAIYSKALKNNFSFRSKLFTSSYNNEAFTALSLVNRDGEIRSTRFGANQKNFIKDYGLNLTLSKTHESLGWSLGLDAVQHDVEYGFSENGTINLTGDLKATEITPFGELKFNVSEKLNITGGLRGTYYDAKNKLYASPRLTLNLQATDGLKLKGSVSQNQQFLRELNYEYQGQIYELWVPANNVNIPIISSNNYMLGATFRIGTTTLDIEAFKKDMTGMIEFAVLNPIKNALDPSQPRDYRLFTGDGRARGIDALLSTSYKSYDTYLSYTLSKTEQSFDEIFRGAYFATENDRRHQLKWINELHLGDFTVGANWIFSTGRPYTDIYAFEDDEDIRNLAPVRRIKRVPSYQRLDLSAGYKFKFDNKVASFNVSLFNALDHKNVSYEQLIESRTNANDRPLNTVIGSEANLLSRTLNLSFRLNIN